MATAIASCLRPGGRFVTVNSNPALFTQTPGDYKKYGFATCVGGPPREGSPVTWTFNLAHGPISVENYYLSVETHEAVLREQGLVDVRWHAVGLAAGAPHDPPGRWDAFLATPPAILLECTRR